MALQRKLQLSGPEHAAIGSIAGVIEVCIQQPTVAVKNAIQEGRPISWKPRHLYRGLMVTCASIAPITAIQFGVNGVLGNFVRNRRAKSKPSLGEGYLTHVEYISIAATAGGVSALVGSPAELIMIQQQRSNISLIGATRAIVRQNGLAGLYRGFFPTFTREAVWSANYLAVGSLLKKELHNRFPTVFGQRTAATAPQAALSSLVGMWSLVTQPFCPSLLFVTLLTLNRSAGDFTLSKKFTAVICTTILRSLHSSLIALTSILVPLASLTKLVSYYTACIGAGLIAVVITQPIDTVKTVMQASALDPNRASFWGIMRQMKSESGLASLYRGFLPRSIRLVGATFILSNAKEFLEKKAIKLKHRS